MLGLIVELGSRYAITSNRESGLGRYDVMLELKNKADKAILLEFQYAKNLMAKGIPAEHIRSYGFA